MHPNFNDRAFKKYEQVIRTVAANFPSAVWYDPSPFTVMTFSCRLRDAMRGLIRYRHDEELASKLEAIHDKVIVAIRDNLIVIGDKDTVKEERKAQVVAGSVIQAQVMIAQETIDSPDEEVIRALCLLSSKRILESVSLTGVSEETVKQIAEPYDVEIMTHSGRIILI